MMICCVRRNAYRTLFAATITNILAGLANFCCIIVYMSSVSKEVGNKIYKASEMDDSLFHYSYGFSLISLKMSFFCTEIAALFSTVVYMSKRDERTYNRYQMSTMLKNIRGGNQADENLLHDRYYQHGRFSCLQRASRSASMDEPLNSTNPTPRKSLYLMPSELVEEPSVDESAVNDGKSDVTGYTLTALSKLSQSSLPSGKRVSDKCTTINFFGPYLILIANLKKLKQLCQAVCSRCYKLCRNVRHI